MSEFSGYRRQTVRANATADGDNVVIAAVPSNQQIVVLGYAIGANAAGVLTFQDTAASPGILASFELVDGGGVSYAGNDDAPAFILPRGTGLELNCAAGVDATGHITYVVVA